MFGSVVARQDGVLELSVGDGVMDEGDEAPSPAKRPILAEDRVVRERRQLAGGCELSLLYAGYYDFLVVEKLEELLV